MLSLACTSFSITIIDDLPSFCYGSCELVCRDEVCSELDSELLLDALLCCFEDFDLDDLRVICYLSEFSLICGLKGHSLSCRYSDISLAFSILSLLFSSH